MAKDVQDTIRELLSNAVSDASKTLDFDRGSSSGGAFSGAKGLAVGAGAAALVPFAAKGIGKLAKTIAMDGLHGVAQAPGDALGDFTSKLGSTVGSGLGDKLTDKIDQSGGPGGIVKDAVKGALPFGGDDDDDDEDAYKSGVPGVGKGRRMPIQQSVDIGVPLETVYNQWSQFEEWPNFMHRVTRVSQEDETTVTFATKIWGKTKEFKAEIETQRPDERIKWRVTEGLTHTGVVTFHELAPRLTRIELSLDVDPGGMLEKLARGARHIKRAARGDLHRFKAFMEMLEHETGAWRGVIEDGEVVEDHDSSYDDKREYSDFEDIYPGSDGQHEDEDEDEDQDREEKSSRRESGSSRRSSSSGSRKSSSSGNRKSSSSSGRSSSGKSSGSGRSSSGGSGSRSRGQSSSGSGTRSRRSSSSRNGGSAQGSSRSRSRSSSNGRSNGQRSGSSRGRS